MTHGVLIPNMIAAQNIDAWQRSAICAAYDLDNGNIVSLTGRSAAAGQTETWTATYPASGSLTGLWMVYEPELVWTGNYRGLDPDVRNFYVAAGKTFTVFKPQLGDILTLTADNFTAAFSANTHANATDGSGTPENGFKLVWGNSQTGSVFSVKYLATTYISLATGAINTQRITAYKVEVVGL